MNLTWDAAYNVVVLLSSHACHAANDWSGVIKQCSISLISAVSSFHYLSTRVYGLDQNRE